MTLVHTVRLLGAFATLALLAWALWYMATQAFRPATPRPNRLERRRGRSIRAHARDLALGPAQLTATLTNLPTFDDVGDDAEPCDMAALMAAQDAEEGRAFVANVERMLALETAVSFGFIYLDEGARR